MFTGLITDIGEIVRTAQVPAGRSLTLRAPWADLVLGESVALDGVCLTVNSLEPGTFSVAAVQTTLERTTVGEWRPGRRVNLERALRAGDRLGGHLVQGHVDGVADVAATRVQGDALILDLTLWDAADGLYVPRGSICVDGVSLTVHAVPAPRAVSLSIVEFTRNHTTLGQRKAGDRVNVELDIVGKYVRHQSAPWGALADIGR